MEYKGYRGFTLLDVDEALVRRWKLMFKQPIPSNPTIVKRELPNEGCYKLIFDGSVDVQSGEAATAFVVRDSHRNLILGKGIYIGTTTVTIAELKGLRKGRGGIPSVLLEGKLLLRQSPYVTSSTPL